MPGLVEDATAYAASSLAARADPAKVAGMQAYMKTDMPFYGVQKPDRVPIVRRLAADFSPTDREEYEALVLSLWRLPHREEKYLALGVARAHRPFIVPESLPLYRRLIVEGAWWDLVDEVTTKLVRALVTSYPEEVWGEVESWVNDPSLWLRRAAVLSQVGAKEQTDAARLFRFCRQLAPEKEFFIRKAIGWALREYSKTDPEAVARFVAEHRSELSPLSLREASKYLVDA
jgi:3-methyladenine DNA glycosylase AlkD